MTTFEIATIPALAAIVYTIIDIVKTAMGGDEKFKRFIPLIACILGAVCGVIAFYFVPGGYGEPARCHRIGFCKRTLCNGY